MGKLTCIQRRVVDQAVITRVEVMDGGDGEGTVVGRSCRHITGIVAHQFGHGVIPHLTQTNHATRQIRLILVCEIVTCTNHLRWQINHLFSQTHGLVSKVQFNISHL